MSAKAFLYQVERFMSVSEWHELIVTGPSIYYVIYKIIATTDRSLDFPGHQ